MIKPKRTKLNELKKRRLLLRAQGNTSQEIATVEHKELTTIKNMFQETKADLGAKDITNAVYIAVSLGIIPPHKE